MEQLRGAPELETYSSGTGKPPKFIAGTPDQVQEQLENLAADLHVDEIIVQDMMTDHQARLRSYDLLADAFQLKVQKEG